MTNWFDMDKLPCQPGDKEYPETIEKSVTLVHKEIEGLEAKGVPASRIFVGGFSQGGAMAIQAGFTYPKKLGGIIAFSGWLLRADT